MEGVERLAGEASRAKIIINLSLDGVGEQHDEIRGVPGNYAVVRVNAVEDQGHYTFEEVVGRARAGALELEYRAAIDEFIQKLRSRSEITINEEALASMTISGAPVEEDETPSGHGS